MLFDLKTQHVHTNEIQNTTYSIGGDCLNIKKLKILIDRSGKTIRQIQVDAGLNSGQLYRILNGTNKTPTFETAEKLANALGVSLDEFRKEEPLWE